LRLGGEGIVIGSWGIEHHGGIRARGQINSFKIWHIARFLIALPVQRYLVGRELSGYRCYARIFKVQITWLVVHRGRAVCFIQALRRFIQLLLNHIFQNNAISLQGIIDFLFGQVHLFFFQLQECLLIVGDLGL